MRDRLCGQPVQPRWPRKWFLSPFPWRSFWSSPSSPYSIPRSDRGGKRSVPGTQPGDREACSAATEPSPMHTTSDRLGALLRDLAPDAARHRRGHRLVLQSRRPGARSDPGVAPDRLKAVKGSSPHAPGPWHGLDPAWPSTWIEHAASLDSAYPQPDGERIVM